MKVKLKKIYNKFHQTGYEHVFETEKKAFSDYNEEVLNSEERLIRESLILRNHISNMNRDKTFMGLLMLNKFSKSLSTAVKAVIDKENDMMQIEWLEYVITALQLKLGCEVSYYHVALNIAANANHDLEFFEDMMKVLRKLDFFEIYDFFRRRVNVREIDFFYHQ